MFKFSGTPADTSRNEFNDNFVQGMNNQKIQNTHRASIKAKVNQVLTDKPSTWASDKGKKRDIRHIVNTNQYYNTVKKQYNKNPQGGIDAAVAHAEKVVPPVMEKRNWFKGAETTSSSGSFSGVKSHGPKTITSNDRGGYNTSQIYSVDASQVGGGTGLRYYQGSGSSRSMQLSGDKAHMNALMKMQTTPSDSIAVGDLPGAAPKKRKKRFGIF
tara:strand:- start:398 stop:1039 length:642 start_codon:yes stop_codon:yes gene_type:complete